MSEAPPGADGQRPSVARLYDYFLGGKNNYPVDREAAEPMLAHAPEVVTGARANRAWLRRVVGHMARNGVDQFLDVGSGLPAQNPTHEVARAVNPDARVVYVDNDPLAAAHSRALLTGQPEHTGVVEEDMRDPGAVLNHSETRRLIDFSRPVGLLLVAVLHFVQDEEGAYEVVDALRAPLCPGSYVAISHGTHEVATANQERAEAAKQTYRNSASSVRTRGHAEVARFFDALDLVDPGLCFVCDWRLELGDTHYRPEEAPAYGGLGRVTG